MSIRGSEGRTGMSMAYSPTSTRNQDRANRDVEVGVAAHHGHPDLRRGDHLDVDASLGERGEEASGDAWVRAHARSDQGDLADVVVVEQAREAHLLLNLAEGTQRRRAVGLREGE